MLLNLRGRTTGTIVALVFVTMILTGCRLLRDYRAQPRADNTFTFALTIEDNQLILTSARLGGHEGKFVLATGHPVSTVDILYAQEHLAEAPLELVIGERFTATLDPNRAELGTAADALLASDLWAGSTISIDYISGVMTLSRDPEARPTDMAVYSFSGAPVVPVTVDGQTYAAIIDTALPDTLVLPRGSRNPSRSNADVLLAGRSFDQIDVAWTDTSTARIGNRMLSRFLVVINYGDRWVGLWPDPRI